MRILRSQAGLGLIEVLIALGILGLIVSVMTTFMTRQLQAQKSVELRGDLSAMKRAFVNQVSCSATLIPDAATACASGTLALNGIKANGSPLPILAAAGTKIGQITYRAECTSPGTVNVRAVHLRAGVSPNTTNPADFIADPLTNEIKTWATPSSLMFPFGSELCSPTAGTVKIKSGAFKPNQAVTLGGDLQSLTLSVPFLGPMLSQMCTWNNQMISNRMMCFPPDILGFMKIQKTATGFKLTGPVTGMSIPSFPPSPFQAITYTAMYLQ